MDLASNLFLQFDLAAIDTDTTVDIAVSTVDP